MKAPKTVYVCSECDYQSPKWLGVSHRFQDKITLAEYPA